MTDERARGLVVGLLISSGSFGGDGKQPQVTLRLHSRHTALTEWMVEQIPGSRLYGPYHHGGRDYVQWIARGRALVDGLLPLLDETLVPELDPPAYERLRQMCDRYADVIARYRAARP